MSAEELLERADKIVDGLKADQGSPDLKSLVVAYKRRRDAEEDRAAAAFAKAVVLRAEREGLAPAEDLSAADLKAEIDRRNEGRDEADLIKPDGRSKAAMSAALAADDAK